ncbi:outer membrane protein assembly factor BamB family protein [Streptomyces sp. NBC_01485]|uniref:outer membrane protein assembly factor BamB family protein n=1 Tax=Streptomyces sp. NBC_01485 TaxID=2903884 RepID=UPI002E3668B3|nr:PQQ-binding-like beta-propeller repeat protein [Streptomyces sp. NBC_01485]
MLLGLGGLGVTAAGVGFAEWRIYRKRSSTGRGPDAEPGSQRWKFDVGGVLYASPSVADGTVYISGSRSLCAVDTDTGEQRWRRSTVGAGSSSPVAAGDAVYGLGTGELAYSTVASSPRNPARW